MKLNELSAKAYQHAYYDVYGAGSDLVGDTPAAQCYAESTEDMQAIIDAYCKETGADVRTPRVWGSVFYDLSFYEMDIYDGYDTTPAPITLPGCDSDNAYALCECYNETMRADFTSAFYARMALDCITDYNWSSDYQTAEFNMTWDEITCADDFNAVMNKGADLFAHLVVDYDDGNATYAYSEDAFECWAYDHEFDADGNLIS